jgi:hypothetical protein
MDDEKSLEVIFSESRDMVITIVTDPFSIKRTMIIVLGEEVELLNQTSGRVIPLTTTHR